MTFRKVKQQNEINTRKTSKIDQNLNGRNLNAQFLKEIVTGDEK